MRKTLTAVLTWLAVSLSAQVKTGIDVLEQNGMELLKGKRIGLLTNPTGIDKDMNSTIDILFNAEGVELTTLFAPEHGVRGDEYAGASVANTKDAKTGLTVYSLHGKVKKPTAAMLEKVDALVYDIQDIGCRSYTFISSMGKLMEAAAENDKEVIVLDRPNPLGGKKVEGPLVEDGYYSFVSQYSIPYIYGLTCGELATLINEQKEPEKQCKLTVVKMEGWTRDMTFDKTGLPWVPTSPQIPDDETAMYYPASGILGELNEVNIGVGYTLPFRVFAAEWVNADVLSRAMNTLKLPGLRFRPITFKPYFGDWNGQVLNGVEMYVTDFGVARLTEVQWYVMQELHRLYPTHEIFGKTDKKTRYQMFDKVCGSGQFRAIFSKDYKFADIKDLWRKDAADWKEMSKKYYMY